MIPAVHFDSLLTGSDCQKLTVQERRFSQFWLLCIKQAVWVRYRLACHKLLLQTLCQMGKITSHQKIICYVYYGNHHRKGRQPHKSLGNCLKLNKASGEFSEVFFAFFDTVGYAPEPQIASLWKQRRPERELQIELKEKETQLSFLEIQSWLKKSFKIKAKVTLGLLN